MAQRQGLETANLQEIVDAGKKTKNQGPAGKKTAGPDGRPDPKWKCTWDYNGKGAMRTRIMYGRGDIIVVSWGKSKPLFH